MILSEPPSIIRSRKLGAPLSKRELGRFLSEAQQQVGLSGAVTILLTTDERLRELNRDFRGKDTPTDVLSFPAEPHPEISAENGYSGDLAISLDTAARQAASFDHPIMVEIKVLILHGLLHLAGLDHETDRGAMARRERALREHFELPAGLIQRAERPARVRQKATA